MYNYIFLYRYREFENDRGLPISCDANGYADAESKPIYLTLDNSDGKEASSNTADFHSKQHALKEKNETVYLKPFN